MLQPLLTRFQTTAHARTPGACPRRSALVLMLVLSGLLIPCGRVHAQAAAGANPLRIAIAGLVHGHVRGHMTAMVKRTDIELVGVYDGDAALRDKFAATH